MLFGKLCGLQYTLVKFKIGAKTSYTQNLRTYCINRVLNCFQKGIIINFNINICTGIYPTIKG